MDNELVLLNVFSFFSTSELIILREVCKFWQWLIKNIMAKKFNDRWLEKNLEPSQLITRIYNVRCCCLRGEKVYFASDNKIFSYNLITRGNIKKKLTIDSYYNYEGIENELCYNGSNYLLGHSFCVVLINIGMIFVRFWNVRELYGHRNFLRNSKDEIFVRRYDHIYKVKNYFFMGMYLNSFIDVKTLTNLISFYIDKDDNFYLAKISAKIYCFDSEFNQKRVVKLKDEVITDKIKIIAVINNYFFIEKSGKIKIYNKEGLLVNIIKAPGKTFVFNDKLYVFVDNKLLIY